jgi:FkbM family methyltransferase
VEAVPGKIAHLKKRFPKVEVVGTALGDRKGEATFYVLEGKNSGFSSLGRPAAEGQLLEIRVPICRLDDIVDDRKVDVIKIDVEGAELGVLKGSESVVAGCRPTIIFESGPQLDEGLGYSKQDLWQWFADRSYAVLIPDRVAHEDPGLGLESFLDSHRYPWRTRNYFAIAKERRSEIRDKAQRILNP